MFSQSYLVFNIDFSLFKQQTNAYNKQTNAYFPHICIYNLYSLYTIFS